MLDFVRLRLRLGSLPDAIRWAEDRLGMGGTCPIPPAIRKPTPDRAPAAPAPDQARRIAAALRIWDAAQSLPGSPAEQYLQGRGLVGLPQTVGEALRFHPRCPRGSGPGAEYLPALVGLLRDARGNQPCGIRRIFLAGDGASGWRKIEDGAEKMALGRAGGAAVKLTPDEDVTHGLAIAEGIESALSLLVRTPGREPWAPVWAAGGAGNIGAFPVLAGIECLTVLADRDASGAGLKAARRCATRWAAEGHEVHVIPPRNAKDWNDVVRGSAA
jgi:hypothetical protein